MLFRSDRKSTRLNSSHLVISYAVFCLKKKKKNSHKMTELSVVENTYKHDRNCIPAGWVLVTFSFRPYSCSLCWAGGVFFFFFNDTATTEIYTLSLHDALPI